ncbi:MAG: hypothetical protein ACTS5I_06980 [Rhodanobacter sp.]
MQDVHATGMCSRGAVAKLKSLGFERQRIMDILQNGIPVSEARMLGDGQMDILVASAEKRAAAGDTDGQG